MRIAVSTSSFAVHDKAPLERLRAAGFELRLNPHGRVLTAEEAAGLFAGCVGAVAGTEPLSSEVLKNLPDLKVISRLGTGLDNVDLAYCAEQGIEVRNTPDGPTLAVAELTLGLILNLLRKISRMDREIRAGIWKKSSGELLSGKKAGIIGFGRIGRAVARLLECFGAQVACCDPALQAAAGINLMSLPELLGNSDIITLHCPMVATPPLIGEPELALMPPGALIVNCARGGLIDEEALAARLASGRIGGAALDVFGREPYQGPLCGQENALLTPHVGSYAKQARILMEAQAVDNLLQGLAKLKP